MNRILKPTVAGLAVLAVGMLAAYAQHDPDHAAPPQLTADRGDRSLHIEGDATALRVEVRQTTIADVLSALARFHIRYRSSTGLERCSMAPMRDRSVRSLAACCADTIMRRERMV